MPVQVCIEELARGRDHSEVHPITTHESRSEALEAAKALVDSGLLELWQPGMAPDYLFRQWSAQGEDVLLIPDDGEPKFSGVEYARVRSQELAYRRRL